ncbi:MAG: DinB family protein [Bryobacteraceae bacterium]|nr:DinB family protein [Bryobacteraceae bacterium]
MCYLLLLCLALPAFADPMTKGERQRLVAHWEMTGSWIADEIAGLSEKQLNFRAAPDKWSVKDVLEHLAIADPHYWKTFQESLKTPIEPKTDQKDEGILWYGIDRTNRNKTAEARTPKDNFKTAAEAYDSWRKLRATMLDYITTTDDDLRGHRYLKSPTDTYQWLLMISTHVQRHILQIREIKHEPSFPKA